MSEYFIPRTRSDCENLIFFIKIQETEVLANDALFHCFIPFGVDGQLMCYQYVDSEPARGDNYSPWDIDRILDNFGMKTWVAIGHIWTPPPVYSVCAECQKELYIEDYLCGSCR